MITNMNYRTENDLLGNRQVPSDSYWGIHTLRALENFNVSGRTVHPDLVRAFGYVKWACARANIMTGAFGDPAVGDAIGQACSEMSSGGLADHVTVDALQGGAGTSTNMNVNEVIANRALEILGHEKGRYDIISPLDHVNLHQSTNDTYPTALRLASIWLIHRLEDSIVALQEAFQAKEKEFADIVKVGRTELQDAVLLTLGRELSTYGEAFTRDRWRIYKCEERLRVVNLGGTAVGTGLGAPRQYIFRVTDELRALTGIGFARAENLVEATANADVFVEVSGILKAYAVSLLKCAGDLRLLSSGPDAGFGEIILPARQAGSSIMPGKVNPVIPEAVSQAALLYMGYDGVIAHASALGNLELSQFLPLVAYCLLDGISILINAGNILRELCVRGIEADAVRCSRYVRSSTASATALVGRLGYEAVSRLVKRAVDEGTGIRDLAVREGMLTAEEFDELVSAEAVSRLGSPAPGTGTGRAD